MARARATNRHGVTALPDTSSTHWVAHIGRPGSTQTGNVVSSITPPPPPQHTHTGLDDRIPPADTLSQIHTADPATETEQGHVTPVSITGPRTHLGVAQTPSRQQAGLGTHIGDGLPPVPAKLVAKICRHEFVEMHELLPEFWQDQKGEGKTTTKAKKRALELTVWLQCFALYVGVLAPRFPLEVPELMAYMIAIIRAAQEYEGPSWAAYDAAYRRQAEAQGLTKWSQINPSLYAICFTGKAKKVDRCDRCLSATHKAEDCSLTAEDDPDVAKRLKAIESAVMALTSPPPAKKTRERSTQVCRNWNKNACSFQGCRYIHQCAGCGGSHPILECPSKGANATPIGPTRRNLAGTRGEPPY